MTQRRRERRICVYLYPIGLFPYKHSGDSRYLSDCHLFWSENVIPTSSIGRKKPYIKTACAQLFKCFAAYFNFRLHQPRNTSQRPFAHTQKSLHDLCLAVNLSYKLTGWRQSSYNHMQHKRKVQHMLTNLKRETLSDQVAARLMEHIVNENLQPGEVLPSEHKLAELFGVSRPVVREALRSLSAQGVVNVVSGKGAIVQPVDDQLLQIFFQRILQTGQSSAIDLMGVRKQLECYSATLAAERRQPEEVSELEKTITSMNKALQATDLDAYAELDVKLHLQIATAAHNEPLSFLIQSIRIALKQIVMQGLQKWTTRDQLNRVQTVHENIVAAIKDRDRASAEQWMIIHFDEAIENLLHDNETAAN